MNNMYYQPNIDRINRQIEELTQMKNQIQQQQPPPMQQIPNTTNIINATTPNNINNNLIEMRVLNDGEQVENVYVNNKTLFMNEKQMILKDTQGKIEKWEINKIYPIDEKDKRIAELEKQVSELKGMISNEYSKSNISNENEQQSNSNDNVTIKSTTKRAGKQFNE